MDVCNVRGITDTEFVQSQSLASVDSGSIETYQSQPRFFEKPESIDMSQNLKAQSASYAPKNSAVDMPTDGDGCVENSEAYKIWQQKKLEGEEMSAEKWQERWSRLRERLKSKNIKKDK